MYTSRLGESTVLLYLEGASAPWEGFLKSLCVCVREREREGDQEARERLEETGEDASVHGAVLSGQGRGWVDGQAQPPSQCGVVCPAGR